MKKTEKTVTGEVDPDVLEYTVGDDPVLDMALVKWDCAGTAAHVAMLAKATNVVTAAEARRAGFDPVVADSPSVASLVEKIVGTCGGAE